MAISSLLRRLGYAKLEDFGLVETAEGRILSTRPTVLDDGLGGKIVGWREDDLAAMELAHWEPVAGAARARPASPLAPTVPQLIHAGVPAVASVSPSGRVNAPTVPPPVPPVAGKRALPGMTAVAVSRIESVMSAPVAVAQSLAPTAQAPQPKRAPTPLPLETAPVPRLESQSDGEPPEDEWEWQIAVARARAAAEWAEEAAAAPSPTSAASSPDRPVVAPAPRANPNPPVTSVPAATPAPVAKRSQQITGTSTTVALPSAQTAMLAADRAHPRVATSSTPRTKAPSQTFAARPPLASKSEPAPLPPAETAPVPRVAESAYGRPALRPKRATSPGFAAVTNQHTARTATHDLPRVRFPNATPATVPSHMLVEDENTSVTTPLVDDDATRPGLLLPSPASTSRRVAAKQR